MTYTAVLLGCKYCLAGKKGEEHVSVNHDASCWLARHADIEKGLIWFRSRSRVKRKCWVAVPCGLIQQGPSCAISEAELPYREAVYLHSGIEDIPRGRAYS